MFLTHALGRTASALRDVCLPIGVALLLAGCAQLPKDVARPVSNALASPSGTPLEALVQRRRDAAATRFDTGFILLNGPPAAYGSRLALVEAAQKTLDLQYYAIHADASSGRLLRGVRDAARRGVRVRILLDDFNSTGRNALVMRMAFEPNIEMRMFNPLPGARGSAVSRLVSSLGDASRLQQRMHNKLFIADNAVAVTGGRNLGNAYFGNAETGNFIDVDVMAAGPIAHDLSRSFDAYWNNERAYPAQSLVTREELDEIRRSARAADESERKQQGAEGTPATPGGGGEAGTPGAPPPASQPPGNATTDAQRARVWDEKALDLATATFVWAPAVVMVDKPAKIAAEPAGPGNETGKAPGLVVTPPSNRQEETRRAASLAVAASTVATGETVVEGLLQLISQARRDLLIVSPYFVPGPDMKQAFAAARARGVRIRVLTNSLASNDAPAAHAGYARHREELLAMGVELFELRSEQAGVGRAFGSSGSGSASGESRSMLHSKVLVQDGQLLVVGSMNLDQRSQLQNTEIALLIQSNELSTAATRQIDTAMQSGSWRVELAEGAIRWRAPQGSNLQDTTTEPDASATLRWMLRLFGPLAPDALL